MDGKKKTTILAFLLILTIIAIILMAFLLYKLNNEITMRSEMVADLNNKISSLENTIDTLNKNFDNDNAKETISTEQNKNEIQYIEMTEENYKKYASEYYMEEQDWINNNDGTVTIKFRLYEYMVELPTITKEQYEELMADKTIDLLGYQMKVSEEENDSGHDLLIESTGDWMKFYVDKNSDGTGTLMYYTEIFFYKGTDIYMQLTVDENITADVEEGKRTLKEWLKQRELNGYIDNYENKELIWRAGGTGYIFENGKCTSIIFSNV